MRAYRKSSKQYIGRLVLVDSTPYDVMMYSGSRQEEMDNGRKLGTRVCGFGICAILQYSILSNTT